MFSTSAHGLSARICDVPLPSLEWDPEQPWWLNYRNWGYSVQNTAPLRPLIRLELFRAESDTRATKARVQSFSLTCALEKDLGCFASEKFLSWAIHSTAVSGVGCHLEPRPADRVAIPTTLSCGAPNRGVSKDRRNQIEACGRPHGERLRRHSQTVEQRRYPRRRWGNALSDR